MKTAAIVLQILLICFCVIPELAIWGAPVVQDPDTVSEGIKLAHPEIPRIPADEVKRMIADKADFVIVDTQPADIYAMWHLPSAVNIPYISTANPMDRQLMLTALPMDRLIVIYCLCEEGTDSAKMALELIGLGYGKDKIKVLEGGLIQWDANDYPVVKEEMPD